MLCVKRIKIIKKYLQADWMSSYEHSEFFLPEDLLVVQTRLRMIIFCSNLARSCLRILKRSGIWDSKGLQIEAQLIRVR